MADPLSISAAIIGIAATTTQLANSLLTDIDHIRDAPQLVVDLRGEVQSVEAELMALQDIPATGLAFLGPFTTQDLRMAMDSCTEVCSILQDGLKQWTKHSSSDEKLSFRDRFKIGILKRRLIKAISARLHGAKATINTAVCLANLQLSVQNTSNTDEIMTIVSGLRTEATEVDGRRRGLRSGRIRRSRTETLEQEERAYRALESGGALANRAASALAEAVTQNNHTLTFGSHNSGVQSGVINGPVHFGRG